MRLLLSSDVPDGIGRARRPIEGIAREVCWQSQSLRHEPHDIQRENAVTAPVPAISTAVTTISDLEVDICSISNAPDS